MASDPRKIEQHRQRERALELGRCGNPVAARELVVLMKSPFADVRRLAASALGKLADARPAGPPVVAALSTAAASDPHPQVRQYALKALARYADVAAVALEDVRDIARNASLRDYVRSAAAETLAAIEQAMRAKEAARRHFCARCGREVADGEYMRSMDRFGRSYCMHCLDERELEGVNFEATVESAKRRVTQDGTAVQSVGERRIADWLAARGIRYVYDARYRIARDTLVRPDFYLPEFDLYIEYWGMDTPEYNANMEKKRWFYQRAGRKLISVSHCEFADIEAVLARRLALHIPGLPPPPDSLAALAPSGSISARNPLAPSGLISARNPLAPSGSISVRNPLAPSGSTPARNPPGEGRSERSE